MYRRSSVVEQSGNCGDAPIGPAECVFGLSGSVVSYGYLFGLIMWFTGWQAALGISAVSALAIVGLWYAGTKKDKDARNPLHGVLAEMSGEPPSTSKQIPLRTHINQ